MTQRIGSLLLDSRRLGVALLATAVVVTAASCGIKSRPQPPLIRVADTTRDLSVFQEGSQAVLGWSYPSSTTAGDPLPDLEAVEVWRATLLEVDAPPPGENARDRNFNRQLLQSNGELIAVLDRAGLDAATRGPMLEWRDDLEAWRRDNPADQPLVLWYAVRSVCCRGRESALSNIARMPPSTPPAAPTKLDAEPEAGGIRLTWTPHEELPVLVERSSDGERWLDITPKPLATGEWLDSNASQDRGWNYRLRSVQPRKGAPRVVGEPGPLVGLFYPDIYPPPAPADLVCLPEGARVRLRWRAAGETVTFNVSRSVDGRQPTALADGIQAIQHEDDAPPSGTLTYEVTATDTAGNESEAAICTAARGSQL